VNHYDRNHGGNLATLMMATSWHVGRLNVSLVGMPNAERVDGLVSLQFGWRL
jgi:hypothetical protein